MCIEKEAPRLVRYRLDIISELETSIQRVDNMCSALNGGATDKKKIQCPTSMQLCNVGNFAKSFLISLANYLFHQMIFSDS